jgi:hypothetical protein
VTSRAEKLDARDVVVALCDGSYEQESRPTAAPMHPTRAVRPCRSTTASNTTAVAARATRIAGPGRGHKGERVSGEGAIEEAARVLKKPKVSEGEWRHALGRLTDEHSLLRKWCDKVCARCVVCVVVCLFNRGSCVSI